MAKTAMIRARVKPELKHRAAEVFSERGVAHGCHYPVLCTGNFASGPAFCGEEIDLSPYPATGLLSGNAHIEPNGLLIREQQKEALRLVRTGTHAGLFI